MGAQVDDQHFLDMLPNSPKTSRLSTWLGIGMMLALSTLSMLMMMSDNRIYPVPPPNPPQRQHMSLSSSELSEKALGMLRSAWTSSLQHLESSSRRWENENTLHSYVVFKVDETAEPGVLLVQLEIVLAIAMMTSRTVILPQDTSNWVQREYLSHIVPCIDGSAISTEHKRLNNLVLKLDRGRTTWHFATPTSVSVKQKHPTVSSPSSEELQTLLPSNWTSYEVLTLEFVDGGRGYAQSSYKQFMEFPNKEIEELLDSKFNMYVRLPLHILEASARTVAEIWSKYGPFNAIDVPTDENDLREVLQRIPTASLPIFLCSEHPWPLRTPPLHLTLLHVGDFSPALSLARSQLSHVALAACGLSERVYTARRYSETMSYLPRLQERLKKTRIEEHQKKRMNQEAGRGLSVYVSEVKNAVRPLVFFLIPAIAFIFAARQLMVTF